MVRKGTLLPNRTWTWWSTWACFLLLFEEFIKDLPNSKLKFWQHNLSSLSLLYLLVRYSRYNYQIVQDMKQKGILSFLHFAHYRNYLSSTECEQIVGRLHYIAAESTSSILTRSRLFPSDAKVVSDKLSRQLSLLLLLHPKNILKIPHGH